MAENGLMTHLRLPPHDPGNYASKLRQNIC